MARAARRQTLQEIAEVFGVAERTVRRNWLDKGCPHSKRDGRLYFDDAEVAAWKQENNLSGKPGRPKREEAADLDEARLHKERAMARNWELRNQQLEGQLLDKDEVERNQVRKVTAVRDRLMSAGASLAPRLEGLNTAERQDEIDRFMRAICEEFAHSTNSNGNVDGS